MIHAARGWHGLLATRRALEIKPTTTLLCSGIMKFSRLQIVLGLALSGLMATGAVHAQSALDTILKNKKIAIGVPPDFPPYGSMDRDFKMHGLDIDMANYIGAKLGVEVDLIPVTSANRIP